MTNRSWQLPQYSVLALRNPLMHEWAVVRLISTSPLSQLVTLPFSIILKTAELCRPPKICSIYNNQDTSELLDIPVAPKHRLQQKTLHKFDQLTEQPPELIIIIHVKKNKWSHLRNKLGKTDHPLARPQVS